MMARRALIRLLQHLILLGDTVVLGVRKLIGGRHPDAVPTSYFVRTDNLGDLLLWLPSLDALCAAEPWSGRRVLIGNKAWTSLPAVAERFDEVIPVDMRRMRRQPTYRLRMLWAISARSGNVVVNPIFSRETITSDALARAIAAPRKIAGAIVGDNSIWRMAGVDRWYTQIVELDVSRQKLLRNAAFVSALGAGPVPPGPARIAYDTVTPLPDGLLADGYVLICPGAPLNLLKSWPAARWGALLQKLSEAAPSLRVVLGGTPAEAAQCAEVAAHSGGGVLNLSGKTDLVEFIALAGNARAVVATETGASHIGPAVGAPTLVMLGGGHFGRFLPYPDDLDSRLSAAVHRMPCFGCNWSCIYVPDASASAPCMTGITVEQAWAALEKLLLRP